MNYRAIRYTSLGPTVPVNTSKLLEHDYQNTTDAEILMDYRTTQSIQQPAKRH